MRYNLFSRAVRLLNQNHSRKQQYLLLRGASNNASSLNTQREEGNGQTPEEVTTADSKKLPAREPLVKNFFLGATDKELLGYPEVIPREEMVNLQNALLPLNNYFAEEQSESQSTQLDNLKHLGLYGLNVPTDYEGKGYKWSASLMASEPESSHTSLALGLQSHRVVVDLLCELGTPEQQQRYLTSLGSGELIATEAILEYTPPEDDFFGTQAIYDSEKRSWTLSGEKAFVIVAPKGRRQLFLVLAQTQQSNVPGNIGRSSTIFLVDAQQKGVRLGETHETFGCREASMQRIHFDQVQLTEEQILGMPHEGNRYAEQLVRASRLRSSLLGIALSKQLLNQLTNYSVDTTQCGIQMKQVSNKLKMLSVLILYTVFLQGFGTDACAAVAGHMLHLCHGEHAIHDRRSVGRVCQPGCDPGMQHYQILYTSTAIFDCHTESWPVGTTEFAPWTTLGTGIAECCTTLHSG